MYRFQGDHAMAFGRPGIESMGVYEKNATLFFRLPMSC